MIDWIPKEQASVYAELSLGERRAIWWRCYKKALTRPGTWVSLVGFAAAALLWFIADAGAALLYILVAANGYMHLEVTGKLARPFVEAELAARDESSDDAG